MSSVLHPVGPEPRERYWVRRLAVLVAAVVAIGIVIALVGNAMSAGSAVQAEPVPPTIVPPVVTTSPTPNPTAVTPSTSASPAASTTPGAATTPATPGATPSASPTPTSTSTASDKKSTASKKAAKDSKSKKKSTKQPVYATCDGSDLRPTLTGDRTVELGKKTTFALSVINGGKKTCKVAVTPSDATLTIVSGGDRIWSTKDCPAALPAAKRTLLPEHALGWKVTWSGKRSGEDCKTSKVAPKKGYYWAIASFDGADDVRFRVILG